MVVCSNREKEACFYRLDGELGVTDGSMAGVALRAVKGQGEGGVLILALRRGSGARWHCWGCSASSWLRARPCSLRRRHRQATAGRGRLRLNGDVRGLSRVEGDTRASGACRAWSEATGTGGVCACAMARPCHLWHGRPSRA